MPRAQLSYIGQDLGVIGPRDSDKNWAPMSISSMSIPLYHSYTHKVIVATVKREGNNNTRMRNQATQYKSAGIKNKVFWTMKLRYFCKY